MHRRPSRSTIQRLLSLKSFKGSSIYRRAFKGFLSDFLSKEELLMPSIYKRASVGNISKTFPKISKKINFKLFLTGSYFYCKKRGLSTKKFRRISEKKHMPGMNKRRGEHNRWKYKINTKQASLTKLKISKSNKNFGFEGRGWCTCGIQQNTIWLGAGHSLLTYPLHDWDVDVAFAGSWYYSVVPLAFVVPVAELWSWSLVRTLDPALEAKDVFD